jgi:transcriptional regulator with XRE-family HTH domain
MGLSTDTSMNMSNAIAERLECIQKSARVTAREVAQLLCTTPETISRWRGGKTEPQPRMRDSLLRLEWLVGELAELYPPEEAHLWLFSPHKMLSGERPVDMIERREMDRVLQIIAQLKDGAYA